VLIAIKASAVDRGAMVRIHIQNIARLYQLALLFIPFDKLPPI
jgi:hypothetical protein